MGEGVGQRVYSTLADPMSSERCCDPVIHLNWQNLRIAVEE
jgi:hypothetical protein